MSDLWLLQGSEDRGKRMNSLNRLGLLLWLLLVPALVRAEALCASVAVAVDTPLEQAWQILSDLSLPHNYVPGIVSTEIVSERKQGIGTHRRVYEADGGYLEETVVAWHDHRGFVLRLHEGDRPLAPFERAEFAYELAPMEGLRTRVALDMTVEMPWGSLGEVLGEWFLVPVLEDKLVQIAAGLKYFYETGQPATDLDREQLAPVVQPTGRRCQWGPRGLVTAAIAAPSSSPRN